ncbi:TnsA-like heteromeric transposase endonuclease subunit [Streptomyces sp. NPDC002809]|uniref:TnsA-like heteromeric transposase endonuclease subunit n=1 Tax=Streptomyces sp. NPDC002809 TaxID=3154433 RepID=UPI0033270FE9
MRDSARECASGVEVGFVDAGGVERCGPMARWWGEVFELPSPVRPFASSMGQKNFTGEYWAATSRTQVGDDSRVERDSAKALDFDPAVVGLASQPFRLTWTDGERERGHTPDYFARLLDGTGVVVDVRPEDLVDEDTAEVFAFTARVCEEVGWQFRHVGDLHQPYRVNLRWLSRYRHVLLTEHQLADLDDDRRLDYDDGCLDHHTRLTVAATLRTVVHAGRRLTLLNRYAISARRGLILSGAAGTGKTTALTPVRQDHRGHRPTPAPGGRRPDPGGLRLRRILRRRTPRSS